MNYKMENIKKDKFAWYVTGMKKGAAGFLVGIIKSTNLVGWSVKLTYFITAGNNPAN